MDHATSSELSRRIIARPKRLNLSLGKRGNRNSGEGKERGEVEEEGVGRGEGVEWGRGSLARCDKTRPNCGRVTFTAMPGLPSHYDVEERTSI